MSKTSSNSPNKVKITNIEKVFLAIVLTTIIISVVITLGELLVAYYELFGDHPYNSFAPALLIAILIPIQSIGIILSLILKRQLRTRKLLNSRNKTLSLIPVYLLLHNILLALVLTLVVNILNGNISQLIKSSS